MTQSRAYYAEYYQANRARIIARVAAYNKANPDARRDRDTARNRARIADNRRRIIALKLTLSCVDCGWKPTTELEVRRLEFDHVDPATKWKPGAKAFNKLWSWARIEQELALCEPRCNSCHSKRTWSQRLALTTGG